MKKLVGIFCFFVFGFTAASAQTAAADIMSGSQELLKEAAQDYFAGRPQQALEKYIEISKETQNKDAFLNAAFIAMESFFITRGVKLFCKSVEVRLLT